MDTQRVKQKKKQKAAVAVSEKTCLHPDERPNHSYENDMFVKIPRYMWTRPQTDTVKAILLCDCNIMTSGDLFSITALDSKNSLSLLFLSVNSP